MMNDQKNFADTLEQSDRTDKTFTKMMFLIFHGFAEHNGISKKIKYQKEALLANGLDVHFCYQQFDETSGNHSVWVNDHKIVDFGNGFSGKLHKRFDYRGIEEYIERKSISWIYMRSNHNANPFTIAMMRRLKQKGVKVFLEIPTYPYDSEYNGVGWQMKMEYLIDRLFRNRFASYVDRIVTFSDDRSIFGRPTVNISNGIDFTAIKLKETSQSDDPIRLIGVAEIHFWHGFDRLIRGLHLYYRNNPSVKVVFDVVGQGDGVEFEKLKRLTKELSLEDYIIFHGNQSGEALDNLFNRAHIGIGSLARHRSNIATLKTLKNREYAARGIPFVYSENDPDFDNRSYILKQPADETPVMIEPILRFWAQNQLSPSVIRTSIEPALSWKEQMKQVISFLKL